MAFTYLLFNLLLILKNPIFVKSILQNKDETTNLVSNSGPAGIDDP